MLDYWICIATDNAALEPGHDFTNNRNVIVDGKEGEIWHLWIDTCIDAFLIYRRTKCDIVCFALKDGGRLLAGD